MRRPSFRVLVLLVLGGLLLAAVVAVWWEVRQATLTREEVRSTVVATLQREAPASFLVTGTLDVTATGTVRNTKTFLPDLLGMDLGTTSATVRMPGRVAYGFDVRELEADDVRVRRGGVVEVRLPPLRVFSVEPDLAAMEVETDVGWARLYARSGRRVEQRAVAFVQDALREQGTAHLRDSTQPRVHTAEALADLLVPVLQAAGLEEPRLQIALGEGIVWRSDAGE